MSIWDRNGFYLSTISNPAPQTIDGTARDLTEAVDLPMSDLDWDAAEDENFFHGIQWSPHEVAGE